MLFNDKMSYPEALKVLYTAVEGKTKEEIDQLRKEFYDVLPAITQNEMSGPPALTSYHFDKEQNSG